VAKVVRVVIPDAGVLISLAQGNLLDLLILFKPEIRIVITDIVEFEVTHRTDLDDATAIRDFLTRNQSRVQVDATSFADLLGQIRSNPHLKLPADAGEMSVYSYVRTSVVAPPGEATLILFEDDWFVDHDVRPGNVHLLSTRAFIAGLERLSPEFPADGVLRRMLAARPFLQRAVVDEPARKLKGGTAREAVIDKQAVKAAGKRIRRERK
jgi:hypothetical protein